MRSPIEDLIYEGCLRLDAGAYHAWLELAAPELTYRIQTYSPEIRKPMTWLEHDHAGLHALFELLPKHHVDHAQWHRHASVYRLHIEADTAQVLTSLVVHHTLVDVGDTHRDSGSTRLFAVGRYRDRLRRHDGRWLLNERVVELDTRMLGIGSHAIV